MNPEELAELFHNTYEELAESFNYETKEESRKAWKDVPENNKKLMIATYEESFLQQNPEGKENLLARLKTLAEKVK